ncbi:MAG: hypothetical protein QOH53_1002 [Ilumatobacteraceae bacterium]
MRSSVIKRSGHGGAFGDFGPHRVETPVRLLVDLHVELPASLAHVPDSALKIVCNGMTGWDDLSCNAGRVAGRSSGNWPDQRSLTTARRGHGQAPSWAPIAQA